MQKGGQSLCQYFQKVEEETKMSPGIVSLPPDIAVCARIVVKRKKGGSP